MQGVMVNGIRPKTKKALKDALKTMPEAVDISSTDVVGKEYDGPATEMPEHKPVYVVGPNPYTERKWYAQIKRSGETFNVV